MTATERLRALLDERGVEWHGVEDSTYWGEVLLTRRDGSNPVYKFGAHKTATNRLSAHLLQVTPEQAVEATLGRGTCKWEPADFITEGEWGDKLLTEADNARLRAENAKLRELVAEIWPTAEYAGYEHELSRARELMRELGYEED